MKAIRLHGVLVALVSLLAWPQAHADRTTLTMTVGGNQHLFDDERQLDDERLPFAAMEFRFTERWAGEARYSVGKTKGNGRLNNNFETEVERIHLDVLYYLQPQGRLHPYMALGGTRLRRDWKVNGDVHDIGDVEANVGAGVHYFLSDNFSLRGDLRYLYGVDDSTSDFVFALGMAYRFGKPAEPKMAVAPPRREPAPAPAAPLDSDGDGVFDDMDDCPGTPEGTRVDDRGCKIKTSRIASIKLLVRFEFDKAVVQERYFSDIEGLANFLKRFEDVHVNVEGHTDSVGSSGYNMALSRRRAKAVADVLVNEYGIKLSRILAVGFGETRPVASNDTGGGRAQNRRVVATLEVEYEE